MKNLMLGLVLVLGCGGSGEEDGYEAEGEEGEAESEGEEFECYEDTPRCEVCDHLNDVCAGYYDEENDILIYGFRCNELPDLPQACATCVAAEDDCEALLTSETLCAAECEAGGEGESESEGECSTCGEFVTGSSTADLCYGTSVELYNALEACTCTGACEAACSDDVCVGEAAGDACTECVLDYGGCWAEFDACATD